MLLRIEFFSPFLVAGFSFQAPFCGVAHIYVGFWGGTGGDF
jgi:hypothetical protein